MGSVHSECCYVEFQIKASSSGGMVVVKGDVVMEKRLIDAETATHQAQRQLITLQVNGERSESRRELKRMCLNRLLPYQFCRVIIVDIHLAFLLTY